MAKEVKFTNGIIELIRKAKILGVRSGTEHRYTGIWVVVAEDRVFGRSWNDKPNGWFRAFRKKPNGTIQSASSKFPFEASWSVARAFVTR